MHTYLLIKILVAVPAIQLYLFLLLIKCDEQQCAAQAAGYYYLARWLPPTMIIINYI